MSARWAQEADPDVRWRLLRWSYGWETGTQRAPAVVEEDEGDEPHEREQPAAAEGGAD